jgi:hypothetical protein
MNESPENTAGSASQVTPTMSLGARLVNIFAAPGEVFDEVRRAGPSAANWLVPVLLAALVGGVSVWIMFSQPAIQQQFREQQVQRMEKAVNDGRMRTEDAQRAQQAMGDLPLMFAKIGGSIGAVVMSFVWVFFLALVVWLLGRWGLRASFPYLKAVEIVGLSEMIAILGGIITLLLVILRGDMMASLSPALLYERFDPANKAHLLMSSLNLMTLWFLGVLACGLARLGKTTFFKAACWLYGLWAASRLALVFSGLATMGM